jgi:hypothetical protein
LTLVTAYKPIISWIKRLLAKLPSFTSNINKQVENVRRASHFLRVRFVFFPITALVPIIPEYLQRGSTAIGHFFYFSSATVCLNRQLFLRPLSLCRISCTHLANVEKKVCLVFFLYSWYRASLDIEILYVTNEMQLFIICITNNALHVSVVFRPSSGAAYTVHKLLMMGEKHRNMYSVVSNSFIQ